MTVTSEPEATAVSVPALERVGAADEPAGLWISSVPWPRAAAPPLALNGQATYNRPLGRWPGTDQPRRMLLVADGGDRAPATLAVNELANAAVDASAGEPPTAEAELFARSEDPSFLWERRRLRINHGGRTIALAMGLRTGGTVHWWEAGRMVVLEQTPSCRVVEMGGAIPLVYNDRTMQEQYPGLTHPLLHKHNWLYGRIYARLHANGVCEVFAQHINSKYVDEGGDLEDAVPVIGLCVEDAREACESLVGEWDGRRDTLSFGGVRLDVSEVSRLATPEQPGRLDMEGDFLAWQPYQGCELHGGRCPESRTGDPFIYRAEQRVIPRGMARTLRFSVSLSERSPRVVRYLPPAWWYGLCEEFHPESLLPVSIEAWDEKMAGGEQWLERISVHGGFEDGCAARGGDPEKPERPEPSWEGELPHAQFLHAWRTGNPAAYELAMRSAYYYTDVAVDHAAKLVRMHGFPPIAFALPMARMEGTLAAYLETGDPYLLETAEAVTEASYRLHRNAWPRMAVGRDAMCGRTGAMLYRYLGNEHFLEMAKQVAQSVVASQRENGSFGDQGGGAGVHQYSGYVTKPWMGLMATNVVLDCLEVGVEDEGMVACVRRFADWLMDERVEREGVRTWSYQHDYDGQRGWWARGKWQDLPTSNRWHQETLARLLGYCAMRFETPAYLDAWAESASAAKTLRGDHPVGTAFQFLPWLMDRLWRGVPIGEGRVRVHPYHFGPRTPKAARLITPEGPIELGWTDDGQPVVPEHVEVAERHGAITGAIMPVCAEPAAQG